MPTVTEAPSPRWFAERTPEERQDYAGRFVRLAEQGEDVDGEARLVDALAPRGARILDAGCGVGRVAAALARAGHRAVGVDADPVLVEAGRELYPDLPLAVLDLAGLDGAALATAGLPTAFDLVVCTGNVLHFVADGTEGLVVGRLAATLVPGGRAVFGFATGRSYTHDRLDADAAAAGLVAEHRFGTWQCDPCSADGDWGVSVLRRTSTAPPPP